MPCPVSAQHLMAAHRLLEKLFRHFLDVGRPLGRRPQVYGAADRARPLPRSFGGGVGDGIPEVALGAFLHVDDGVINATHSAHRHFRVFGLQLQGFGV